MKTSISKAYSSDQDMERITRSTRALFVAILSRALRDIFKPTRDGYDFHKQQALNWLEVNDRESFTSFLNICDYLDIDEERVRRRIYIKMSKIEPGVHSKSSARIDKQWTMACRSPVFFTSIK